jgi:hypothetical protein
MVIIIGSKKGNVNLKTNPRNPGTGIFSWTAMALTMKESDVGQGVNDYSIAQKLQTILAYTDK